MNGIWNGYYSVEYAIKSNCFILIEICKREFLYIQKCFHCHSHKGFFWDRRYFLPNTKITTAFKSMKIGNVIKKCLINTLLQRVFKGKNSLKRFKVLKLVIVVPFQKKHFWNKNYKEILIIFKRVYITNFRCLYIFFLLFWLII